jgi:phosphate acetyltransferase
MSMLQTHAPYPRLAALAELARSRGALRVGVVYPCETSALAAALEAHEQGFIVPVLIGPKAQIRAIADAAKLTLDGIEIVDSADALTAARQGVVLADKGDVGALMKGSLHTDEMLGAVVGRDSPLRTGRRISHVFWFDCPAYHKPLMLTDAVVNIAPTLMDKADIIRNAVDLAQGIGIKQPKIAVIAPVETVNPALQSTLDAAALCKMADRGQISGTIIDGPLGFDNAVSTASAHTKGIASQVAGDPDILVVPNLDAGNSLYKSIVYFGGAACAGVVLGTRIPVILTSRADSPQARVASCALATLAARRA